MRELKRPAGERGARARGTQGETTAKKKVWFPAWAADRRPDRFTLLLAAAAALGAGLVFLRLASYGPGIPWDALNYITVARNLLAGDGFVSSFGRSMVYWPPLYPAMLAAGGLFGFDLYAVAGPLNAIIFGLTVLVAGWWLRRHLRSRFLQLWGCFSIALALPLAEVASQSLSESAFILFVTLSLTQIDAHLGGGGRASLIRAAAFSALACLTRYMGVSVILAVVPMLLEARVAPREKTKRIAVYTLIAAVPVGLWMLRNFLVAGSTTGERGWASYSFPFIVHEDFRLAVGDWWLVGLAAPVLLALVMAACHAFCRHSDRKRDAPGTSDVVWGPLRVFVGFALAYLTLLVAAMLSGGIRDGLQWRYLAPVYIPLLFAALLLMDGALWDARNREPRGIVPRWRRVPAIGGGALAAVLMLALSLQAAWLVVLHEREVRLWNAGMRQEYAVPWARDSESVRYIREAALTGAIVSNDKLVTTLYAGGSARHYELPCVPGHLRPALSVALGSGEVHVLYFSDSRARGECSRQQHDVLRNALSREPLLELVAELADGKLYRLRERDSLESPRPAMFRSSDAPVVGKQFGAFLSKSHGRRLSGEPWRWEKGGGDADGWTSLPVQRPTYMYTPTVADVGHRLRASVYYADHLGNRVKAITEPSEPVRSDLPKVVLAPHGSEDGRGGRSRSGPHNIRSRYDVYLQGNRLTYENRSCRWEGEYGTRFPVIVYSLDYESGMPERDTLGFAWRKAAWQNNGACVTERRLPDKDIFGIRTGQVDRDGNPLWEAEHWFKEKQRWFDELWSSATSGEPEARGVFDVYLGAGSLIFVKDPCARVDTEAKFFLHLVPADVADLPDHRKQHGFDNRDFYFDRHGERFDDKCLAKVPLPEYGIAKIRNGISKVMTGQLVRVDGGFDKLWKARFRR